ncbi:kinase-like domain-containing protein [Daedaleopsis nitida]|nr:kinase-like domain-containing protein [Daedaleopsis nitida]
MMNTEYWSGLQDIFYVENLETIAESTAAYVTRGQLRGDPNSSGLVAIKSGSTNPKFSAQPHDIGKELRILSSLSHSNVIEVLGQSHDSPTHTVHYWMPFVPLHLSDILSSPRFSPHSPPGLRDGRTDLVPSFLLVTKSLVYQILSALAYIHARGIAHRDVKPHNLLMTREGCIKLVDFGVAWAEEEDDQDLWPEPRGRMCFDVASGPYRAPELLFGTRDYDASAIDLWGMGSLLAEFFTPLRLRKTYDEDEDWYQEDDSDEESEADNCQGRLPFVIPKNLSPEQRDIEWVRDSLYDATRGQIGLAWSIFKVHGTPTEETWPTFKKLPDAQKVSFIEVPPVNLITLLPNLPGPGDEPEREDCLDLIRRLLVYPPDRRMHATDALKHQLFTCGFPLLLPTGYPNVEVPRAQNWNDRGLGSLLVQYLSSAG